MRYAVVVALCLWGCKVEDYDWDTKQTERYALSGKGVPDADFELLDLVSGSGAVKAVHVRRPSGRGDTILYFHGIATNIELSWDRVAAWYALGFDVFIVDYRGFGASSSGDWTEASLYADAEASWHALLERADIGAEQVVIYGHSLGGPVAAEMALRHEPGALVLESTFTSAADQLQSNTYFDTPDSFLTRLKLDTERKLARMAGFPKLILHGKRDDAWPVWNAHELLRAATAPKKLFLCAACGHADVPFHDPDWYRESLCFNGAPAPLDACVRRSSATGATRAR